MRRVFVPACCLSLLTWASALGPEPSLAKLPDAASRSLARAEADTVAAKVDTNIRVADIEAPRTDATEQSAQRQAEAAAVSISSGYADQYEIPDPVAEAIPTHLKTLKPIVKPIIPRSRAEICGTLTDAAHRNDLPTPYFIRLLYQESAFRPGIVSSAGAEGVAQFLPETAADRGLDNPFDPVQAITASASLLRDLARRFGNLGLAAAAYNAGPKRVLDWLANKVALPQETKDYVRTITGRPAESWKAAEDGSPAIKLQRGAPCQEAAGLLAWNGPDQIPLPPADARKATAPAHKPAPAAADPIAAKGGKATHPAHTAKVAIAGATKSAEHTPAKEPAKPRDGKVASGKPKHRHLRLSER